MFTGLKPEYEKTDLWIQFGKTISYPDVTSHKQLRSQLNYGMVIGRNPQVGNLIVENCHNCTQLCTKHIIFYSGIQYIY